MFLSVKERLMLLSIVPAQGDFLTLKIVRKLREELSFSEEEHSLLQFRQDQASGMTRWSDTGEKQIVKDVQIGEKAIDIIADGLKKLNDEKKLTMDTMELYEKFVEKKE